VNLEKFAIIQHMERLPNSNGYEIVKTTKRDGYVYSDGNFEYTPPGWVKISCRWYPLGYRVTTLDNKSLGLAGNTDILTYKLNGWVGIRKKDLIPGIQSRGGVWTAIDRSGAWDLERHCRERWNMRTKTFLAAVRNPVGATSYRIKSQAIMLLEELR
jgi:hypothetical protein